MPDAQPERDPDAAAGHAEADALAVRADRALSDAQPEGDPDAHAVSSRRGALSDAQPEGDPNAAAMR